MALSNSTKQSINEFDVQHPGAIRMNSSKVPAQEGVYSLVIAAGGTGVDALLETKGLINMTCCEDANTKNKPTPNVAYRAFDTDKRSVEEVHSSARTGGVMLDAQKGEFVQMKAPDIATFLSDKFRDSVPEYIRSWLDFGIDPIAGGDGAGGIRQCGRLLMFMNIDRVKDAIESAIRTMVAGKPVEALNIYLMTGVGGGTGSGTFIDLAYIARQVASEILPNKVTMYGYIFMPDVNLSKPVTEDARKYIQKNGYAALKELDYLMNMHEEKGKFVQRYSDNFVVDTDMAPFQHLHLISGSGTGDTSVLKDPYRHGMWAVAQSVLSFVAQEQAAAGSGGFAMRSHYVNIKRSVDMHVRKYPERRNPYLALGASSYELPMDDILLYVTSLLFEKMDGMFGRTPTQEEVNKAYVQLGLAPGNLLAALKGNPADLAPAGCTWEDLFGKNAKYNLSKLCDRYLDGVARSAQEQASGLLQNFEKKFEDLARTWFVDGTKGPIWVNHLIVAASTQCKGLMHKTMSDYNTATGRMGQSPVEQQKRLQVVKAKAAAAEDAGALFGDRQGKTEEYIHAMNEYANICAEYAALTQMQNIYNRCREIIADKNNKLFELVVEVLNGLRDVCKKNADILTHTELSEDEKGNRQFSWKPLRIPDISDVIRQAFDANNDAQETIQKFASALIESAYEWADGQVDVRGFIRQYLDNNLSQIANRSLEAYVTAALQGANLDQSVQTVLAPVITENSKPLFSLTDTADKGDYLWLLSVPEDCPNILKAFQNYKAAHPDLSNRLTVQATSIKSRIFAQSVMSAVPLSAYRPLSGYETIYLQSLGDNGLHLRMGSREHWKNLPTPIPYRSRPKALGAYPNGIKNGEENDRQLFQKCRDYHIIRTEDATAQTEYKLHIAVLPNLEERFSEQSMREGLKWSAEKLEQALAQLDAWLENGLPDVEITDEVRDYCYNVALCAIPGQGEEDKREEIARECFIGQYNNILRARKELEKYTKLQAKRDQVAEWYRQAAGVVQQARQVAELLVSGEVRLEKNDRGEQAYVYGAEDRVRVLLKVMDCQGWREAALAGQITGMLEGEEENKRILAQERLNRAHRQYLKMDNAAKLGKVNALLKAVSKRHGFLREDLLEGVADEGVTQDTVNFYEKLVAYLKKEQRELERLVNDGDDEDEF